jgi:hypothetical protein
MAGFANVALLCYNICLQAGNKIKEGKLANEV